MKFIEIPVEDQKRVIAFTQGKCGMPEQIIEKDWWVSAVMRALFSLPYAEKMSLKGGTSLSKCWNIINRFSEDLDIAVARDFLGYGGELSKTQISDKLRRAACTFVRDKLQFDLKNKMLEQGIPPEKFEMKVNITPVTTTDPEAIYVEYQSVYPVLPYIRNTVKLEISGRSMDIPLENVPLRSIIEDMAPQAPFSEQEFSTPTVRPERTFLEKICLLHEEFMKECSDVRVDRMSRHLYDIAKILKTDIAERAIADKQLFTSIVEHRRKFIGLKGFDYSSLCAEKIAIVPPDGVVDKWREDYLQMSRTMMYGDTPSFDEVMADIMTLNKRLRMELGM